MTVARCLIQCGTKITTEQYYEASNEEMTLSLMCNDQMLSDALLLVTESTRLSSEFHSVSTGFIHILTSQIPGLSNVKFKDPFNEFTNF